MAPTPRVGEADAEVGTESRLALAVAARIPTLKLENVVAARCTFAAAKHRFSAAESSVCTLQLLLNPARTLIVASLKRALCSKVLHPYKNVPVGSGSKRVVNFPW